MKKIINLFLLGILVTGLSSCLKDTTMIGPDSPGAVKNVVEFANPDYINSGTGSIYPVYVKSFDVLVASSSLTLPINYAGTDVAPQAITVKLALDPTLLTTYNAKIVKDARDAATILGQDPDEAEDDVAGDLVYPLPASQYTLPSMDVVIPAGQRLADFIVTVKPSLFTFGTNTALGFKIVSASSGTVSGNFGQIIVKIGGKNQYDGVYTYTSTTYQNIRGNITVKGAQLVTSGPQTVTIGLGGGYYTGNISELAVDPATNKVTVVNSGGVGVPTTDPSSNWNPTTKTLYVKWTTTGGYKFEETYKYTGARP